MEIIGEILLAILQFIGELLLQLVFEFLAELGLHSLKAVFEERPHPALAAIGYILLGAGAGGLSLLIVPQLIIHDTRHRFANLLLTPLAAGAIMAGIGALRRRRDQEPVRIDRFGYGALFAFSMAAVRFLWGGGI